MVPIYKFPPSHEETSLEFDPCLATFPSEGVALLQQPDRVGYSTGGSSSYWCP
jgi:hypothetical protein